MAQWWGGHPAIAALSARLAALDAMGEADAAALLGAAGPLMADTCWLRDAVTASVKVCAADPFFEPPFRPLDPERQRGFVLFDDRRLRISLRLVPLERIAAHKSSGHGRSIGFTGAETVTRVIRAGGAVLDLWEAPPAGDDFAMAGAGRCRRAGRMALEDGLRFRIDGTRQAWTIARQHGDMLLLQASARRLDAPLAAEYDAASGILRGASATDGAVARMQLMATLLRQMRRRDAVPMLAALAEEGPFFQRWHMARELAVLDSLAAAPVLRRLSGDSHTEVRAAAARTLALLAA